MFWFCWESLCLWVHFSVFWLHSNIKRHHSFLRIAWRALSPVHTKYPKHSSSTKEQTQNCGPLSQAPLSEIHVEFFPLPVKCYSCSVCICLWSHFVWDYLIVPHARSIYYSPIRHLNLSDAVFLICLSIDKRKSHWSWNLFYVQWKCLAITVKAHYFNFTVHWKH